MVRRFGSVTDGLFHPKDRRIHFRLPASSVREPQILCFSLVCEFLAVGEKHNDCFDRLENYIKELFAK
jgi:hypothetical protein